MDLVGDNFAASTAALQVSQQPHGVLDATEISSRRKRARPARGVVTV